MEDALVHIMKCWRKMVMRSLNPCCNGRCTRTVTQGRNGYPQGVLILVVMEDALVRQKAPENKAVGNVLILVVMEDALVQRLVSILQTFERVLILVVMEDALVLQVFASMQVSGSLNPCCNGRCTRTCSC